MSYRDRRAGLALAILLFVAPPPFTPVRAATLHVPSGYPTITLAMQAASPGDVIEVACGTYNEHDINMKSGVTLRSATGEPSCVIVDAGGLGRVFLCAAVDAGTRIEGLTVTGGSIVGTAIGSWGGAILCVDGGEMTIIHCVFEDNLATFGRGGGLSCVEASPRVQSCVFRRNHADRTESTYGDGGAVMTLNSEASFEDCIFEENTAARDGGGVLIEDSNLEFDGCEFRSNQAYRDGGGIRCNDSSPAITDCSFHENVALHGGGISVTRSSPTMTGCAFVNNEAGSGGAIYCLGAPTFPVMVDCRFLRNRAQVGGAAYANDDTHPSFAGCLFFQNQVTGWGGALAYNEGAGGSVVSCTFAYNGSEVRGATIDTFEADPFFDACIIAYALPGFPFWCATSCCAIPRLQSCDVFGNESGDWIGCIVGQDSLNGNFTADPLFCDPEGGDFTLEAGSPCLPGGRPGGYGDQVGAFGQGCGVTATEAVTWGTVKRTFR